MDVEGEGNTKDMLTIKAGRIYLASVLCLGDALVAEHFPLVPPHQLSLWLPPAIN